jgi:hypothetical protein
MQLLLSVPLLLQLLHLAFGNLASVGQLGRQTLSIPLLVLGIALEQVLGRDLCLGPLLLLGLLPCFASYTRNKSVCGIQGVESELRTFFLLPGLLCEQGRLLLTRGNQSRC